MNDEADILVYSSSNPAAASFAYERLLRYTDAADLQQKRITQAKQLIQPSPSESADTDDPELMMARFRQAQKQYEKVLVEIHFYLISWVTCQNMMKMLSELEESQAACAYYKEKGSVFARYRNARHFLEHFDERLPGQKNVRIMNTITAPGAAPRTNYGGITRDMQFTYSDSSCDVSAESVHHLKQLVSEFLSRWREDLNREGRPS
ncbi:MAG: hypothetical protein WD492_13000 [Alkalispirochaeta sp.]